MDAHALKQAVARAAIKRIDSQFKNDIILGIGTGSTAECFIAELPQLRDHQIAPLARSPNCPTGKITKLP